MKEQKLLEILVIFLALVAIVFALASCLYKSSGAQLKVVSIVVILISLGLNIYSNIRKKNL